MNKEIELLNYIYQNTQMAILSIEQIILLNDHKKFIKSLNKQLATYKKIQEQSTIYLNLKDITEKEISSFTKIKTYLMINIQTLTDKSIEHLASMLIIGSTMGVIDTIKKINAYNEVEYKILNLIKELKDFEEQNIENLKTFL